MRRAMAIALTLAVLASPAAAKEWARALFSTTSHDFGAVARGANVEFRFVIDNIYLEDVHIVSVTSSCGCTIPQVTKNTIKTYETAELVAQLDTRRFHGHKEATLKVVFDKPFPAEVQLHVTANIRSDVVVEPGSAQFGSVSQGKPSRQRLLISYAGRKDWRIVDVASACKFLGAELRELNRSGETPYARVEYELTLVVKENAPAGYFREQAVVRTNDTSAGTVDVPIVVEGQVVPSLTVSPGSLMLGVLRPQQTVARNIVVRGDKPFHILRVLGPDNRFQFTLSNEAKLVHIVPVSFTAGPPGHVAARIQVETDMPGAGPVEVPVDGDVVAQ